MLPATAGNVIVLDAMDCGYDRRTLDLSTVQAGLSRTFAALQSFLELVRSIQWAPSRRHLPVKRGAHLLEAPRRLEVAASSYTPLRFACPEPWSPRVRRAFLRAAAAFLTAQGSLSPPLEIRNVEARALRDALAGQRGRVAGGAPRESARSAEPHGPCGSGSWGVAFFSSAASVYLRAS